MGNSSNKQKSIGNGSRAKIYFEGELLEEKLDLNDVMRTQFLHAVINHSMDSLRHNPAFESMDDKLDSIIGLRTMSSTYGVDYLLMNKHKSDGIIKSLDELELILKPNMHKGISNLHKYKLLRTIGKGGFSMVYVVRCKMTAKIYALKVMNKETIEKWGKSD
jgi:hypothetical protein